MMMFSPSRILHGSQMDTLFDEAGICARLGGYALLVTDAALQRNSVITDVRGRLERAGIESILFDVADENANSGIVKNGVSLASGGRAGYVIGLGSQSILDIGKIIAIAAGTGMDVHDLIDTGGSIGGSGALPYLAIPTRCWNPLVFSGLGIIIDARDGIAKCVQTGGAPDTVVFSSTLPEKLTTKQIIYDTLCILESTIEANREDTGCVGYPLISHAFETVVSILRSIPIGETGPNRGAAQIAGIHSAWFSSHPEPGSALGRAAHALTGIAPEWITAALLPGVTDYWIEQESGRVPRLLSLLGLETTENPQDDAVRVGREIRSLTALADVPLRLRDLGLEPRIFSSIAESASPICGIGSETLEGLLNASL